jgi:hypothetical protein
LINELEIGEKSRKIKNFDRNENRRWIKVFKIMADYIISEKALEDLNNIWFTPPKIGLLKKQTDITT